MTLNIKLPLFPLSYILMLSSRLLLAKRLFDTITWFATNDDWCFPTRAQTFTKFALNSWNFHWFLWLFLIFYANGEHFWWWNFSTFQRRPRVILESVRQVMQACGNTGNQSSRKAWCEIGREMIFRFDVLHKFIYIHVRMYIQHNII